MNKQIFGVFIKVSYFFSIFILYKRNIIKKNKQLFQIIEILQKKKNGMNKKILEFTFKADGGGGTKILLYIL